MENKREINDKKQNRFIVQHKEGKLMTKQEFLKMLEDGNIRVLREKEGEK